MIPLNRKYPVSKLIVYASTFIAVSTGRIALKAERYDDTVVIASLKLELNVAIGRAKSGEESTKTAR